MTANRSRLSLCAIPAALAVLLAGCPKDEAKPEAPKTPPAPAMTTVTVLVTADELGWLLPVDGKGGAAELLGQ